MIVIDYKFIQNNSIARSVERELTDGSNVYDIEIIAEGKVIFSATTYGPDDAKIKLQKLSEALAVF